jgi:hypothetical protein
LQLILTELRNVFDTMIELRRDYDIRDYVNQVASSRRIVEKNLGKQERKLDHQLIEKLMRESIEQTSAEERRR